MADLAFFLISVERRTPAEVARSVRQVADVREAHVTMGDHDVIAIAETDGTKAFPTIGQAIARIDGVARVATCVVVRV